MKNRDKIIELDKALAEQREARDRDYEAYEKEGRIWGSVPRERIAKIRFPRVKQEIVDAFLSIEDMSSTVSDVLDQLGYNGAIPSTYLKPLEPGSRMAGTAVTIRNLPARKTATQGMLDHDFMPKAEQEPMALAEPGDICVYDSAGNVDVSSLGGNGASVTLDRGIAGCIIYGACRDAGAIRAMGLPVFCTGTTQVRASYRMQCAEINGPVNLCGRLVEAGDLIVADDSGVCIVPYELVETVLEKCRAIVAKEQAGVGALRAQK